MRTKFKTHIYGLYNEVGELRYVGKTRHLARRLYAHIKTPLCRYCSHWIQNELRHGRKIEMRVIATVIGDGCKEEQEWIYHYRCMGARLTNLTDGGEGVPGRKFKHSEATKEKLRKLSSGRIPSQETRKKISKALKGVRKPKFTEEHCLRISESKKGQLKGIPKTKQHRINISKGHTGVKLSESHIQSIRNRVFTDEWKRNISIGKKGCGLGLHHSEEWKNNIRKALIGKNKGKTWSVEAREAHRLAIEKRKRESIHAF